MTELTAVNEDVNTPEVPDNIIIPNPSTELRTLFKWLKDNTTKDSNRISICAIWLDENKTFWATNGYSMVKAEMYTADELIIPPGHWFINEVNGNLIHFIKANVTFPDVKHVWNERFSLEDNATPTFDPAVLASIAKPFDSVIMHCHRHNGPLHLLLRGPNKLPAGSYNAILMPITRLKEYKGVFEREFNVTYVMPEVFDYHSDPGHSWLQVDIKAIEELGLQDEISAYSYLSRNNIAYLEEDLDAVLFDQQYQEKYGKAPLYNNIHSEEDSWIRDLPPYPSKKQQFVPVMAKEPEPINNDLYIRKGFPSRDDYLESLADTYGVDVLKVHMMADALGEYEDFDGLISELEDLN